MLARRLTTILPAMTLAEAIDTTRIHRVPGLTSERTAVVTTRPGRAPHHTIADAGLIGRCRATCRGRTMGYSFWMNCWSSGAMSSRSCANRLRRVSHTYNLPHVLDLNAFAGLAIWLMAVRDSSEAR
jgi:hypothetical protein